MRKSLLVLFLFSAACEIQAQDFPGHRAGNYTGVNGVFFNPANVADSRYRFDINLFSVSTSVGNNKASFNLKTLSKSFDTDSLQEQVFGKNAGPSSGMVNVALHGPSVMVNVGKTGGFALTTRARTIANIIDVDGRLVNELSDKFKSQQPFSITSNEDMRIAVNSWSEIGLSYGRILFEEKQHFIKGGITLKYLAGVANGYMNINNFKGSINEDIALQDAYLSNTTGRLAVGFGGKRISDFEGGASLNMESTGFGGDLGFVYEFRPEYEQYKLDSTSWRNDRNKYKVRFGLALLDVGKIKYDRDKQRSGAYDLGITGSERLYFRDLENLDIDDYNAYFKSRPQFFTPVAGSTDATYKVALPSTLQLNVDYRLHRGWYVNLESQLPLTTGEKTGYDPRYYGSVTLTPRYEGRAFGFYMPINHNALTKLNVGTSFRFGPLFVGSGSVLTALLGDSKQADVHIGLRFGGLQKDKVKIKEKKEEKERKRKEREANKAADKSA